MFRVFVHTFVFLSATKSPDPRFSLASGYMMMAMQMLLLPGVDWERKEQNS